MRGGTVFTKLTNVPVKGTQFLRWKMKKPLGGILLGKNKINYLARGGVFCPRGPNGIAKETQFLRWKMKKNLVGNLLGKNKVNYLA